MSTPNDIHAKLEALVESANKYLMALQNFANDGSPERWARHEIADKALKEALATAPTLLEQVRAMTEPVGVIERVLERLEKRETNVMLPSRKVGKAAAWGFDCGVNACIQVIKQEAALVSHQEPKP